MHRSHLFAKCILLHHTAAFSGCLPRSVAAYLQAVPSRRNVPQLKVAIGRGSGRDRMLPILAADQLDRSILQRRTVQAPDHRTRNNARFLTCSRFCIRGRIWRGLREKDCC